MADDIVARDLMLVGVARIGGDRSLADAVRALIAAQADPEAPNALVVVDADGGYEGLLTAKLLLESVLKAWMPAGSLRDEGTLLEENLFDAVRDRARLEAREAVIRDLPSAAPGARLLRLIELSCDRRLEFVPVVEDGRPLGVVPITEVFNAAASLALHPEDEGIQVD